MKDPLGNSASNEKLASRGIAAYRNAMGKGAEKTGKKEGLLKTGQQAQRKEDKPPEPASKYRRAAQFMVLIGSDEASKILSRLESDQVEAISKEIVSLKSISPEEAESVLEEFRSLLSPVYGYSGSSKGGVEEARRLLYAAFGPEKGETVLVKAVPEAAENPFDFLNDFTGEQIALLFRNESPAACAMVFSRLPSKLSAEALANTRPDRKTEIVLRIARLKETSPEVIERTAAALREKARHFGRNDAAEGGEIDGKGVLAAILKQTGPGFGSRLLEEIEEDSPLLGREIKDRIYTLEDVCNAADRPIQEKLSSMEDKEIALLLKSRTDAFAQKILGNVSQTRAERIKEESDFMGAVPKVEAEAAAREFLAWFRLNREEGRIMMLTDEDVFL
jgi:flagellar motor switch protein FliG